MKYCLVADDGESKVVVGESNDLRWISAFGCEVSYEGVDIKSTCKWRICRRDPSHNGYHLVTIETWEKGKKV